jgi:hypothetical protein
MSLALLGLLLTSFEVRSHISQGSFLAIQIIRNSLGGGGTKKCHQTGEGSDGAVNVSREIFQFLKPYLRQKIFHLSTVIEDENVTF